LQIFLQNNIDSTFSINRDLFGGIADITKYQNGIISYIIKNELSIEIRRGTYGGTLNDYAHTGQGAIDVGNGT